MNYLGQKLELAAVSCGRAFLSATGVEKRSLAGRPDSGWHLHYAIRKGVG